MFQMVYRSFKVVPGVLRLFQVVCSLFQVVCRLFQMVPGPSKLFQVVFDCSRWFTDSSRWLLFIGCSK